MRLRPAIAFMWTYLSFVWFSTVAFLSPDCQSSTLVRRCLRSRVALRLQWAEQRGERRAAGQRVHALQRGLKQRRLRAAVLLVAAAAAQRNPGWVRHAVLLWVRRLQRCGARAVRAHLDFATSQLASRLFEHTLAEQRLLSNPRLQREL